MRVNERIRIDGRGQGNDISDSDFSRAYELVETAASRLVDEGKLPWHPSFFEMLTAMAFLHFAASEIEIAILEVGMGGRLDATNVVEPVVSVITDISLDHQNFLGETIAEIAGEKAGIIHDGGLLVTLPQHPQANDVIGRITMERGATAVSAVPFVPPLSPGAQGTAWDQRSAGARNLYPLSVMGREITVDSPLAGRHQLRNIALAIAAAGQLHNAGVTLSAEDIERGIRDTLWPGRFQVLPPTHARPEIVLDVAHNPAGAWALRAALSERYSDRRITLLFAVLRDKAVGEIAEILFPIAEQVVITAVNNPRAAQPEEVAASTRAAGDSILIADFPAALDHAISLIPKDGLLVITGSIYLVGAAISRLQHVG
jgi:dihydrofolate synthase/folylpolyglutamate synthase